MVSFSNRRNSAIKLGNFVVSDTTKIDTPIVCVTIDTEEEFNWGWPFSRRNTSTNSLLNLIEAQKIFERYNIVPTYAIDYPVATSPHAQEVFGPWVESGQAIIGAHLHPWVTPPFEEVVCPFNSYPCNLDRELERRKLTVLTEAITEVFRAPPKIYKAGRYGYDISREDLLIELGFTVDASIMPFRSYAGSGGGPDFFDYPDQPFWTSSEYKMLHIPVLHTPVGALRRLAHTPLGRYAFGGVARRLHIPGLLARLGLVELLLLSPEGNSSAGLYRMVKTLKEANYKIFSFTFHSTSLAPGNTPYNKSEADVSVFLGRIDKFFETFMDKFGGEPKSHLDLAEMLRPNPAG